MPPASLATPEHAVQPRWHSLPETLRRQAAVQRNSILLESSRPDAENTQSLLFCEPVAVLSTDNLDKLPQLFAEIDAALEQGWYVAGYLSYECGYHFEPVVDYAHTPQTLPLAWFGVYREPVRFDHRSGTANNALPSPAPTEDSAQSVFAPRLELTETEYAAAIARIHEWIAAGDTYQVNFTDAISSPTELSALALYRRLLAEQPVDYGALITLEQTSVLSFSPELFFRLNGREITARPMKGTMPRGRDCVEDSAQAERLRCDTKNRAEHVMIVDLLRNDLGRIAEPASVRVEALFAIERYRTLLQMTSTIRATLRSEVSRYEIFRSLFPCGSITGAPKPRTMQIIRALEQRQRGIYTGSIGYFAPDGSATFNVAIRTLVLEAGRLRMGVGGGIVADSVATEERRECELKAAFLSRLAEPQQPALQLIETLRWQQGEFRSLDLHLERLEDSARYFDFPFDREALQAKLQLLAGGFDQDLLYRVRLLLAESGAATLEHRVFHEDSAPVRVRIAEARTHSGDLYLRHKTNRRSLYSKELAEAEAAGFREVLFLNEREELTEGAISNLFVQRDGRLLTPPLRCGLLPGIFRREVLANDPRAQEAVLTLKELRSADAVFFCNSLRGMRRAQVLL